MLRKILAVALLSFAGMVGQVHAQSTSPVLLPGGCGTGNITNSEAYPTVDSTGKLCVNATVTASVSGFTPNGNFATLTMSSTTASVALPAASTVVAFQNTGTTTVSCNLGIGAATATANEIQVPASSTVFVTVGTNTFGACIDQSGSTANTVVLAGGAGLGTGFGGGGSSGGGGLSVTDAAAWTTAVSAFTPTGGVFNNAATALTAGQQGTVRLNANREMHVDCDTGNVLCAAIQASIPAGTNLIGKAGIDQTTPGTTNGVQDAATGSTGASAPTKALEAGGIAQNAEATAVTNGQLKSFATDLVGKLINMPYANKENFVYGTTVLSATTASTSFVPAPGGSNTLYITSFQCINSDSTNDTLITLQNGSGGSTVWQGSAGHNSNGFAVNFPVPLGGTTLISANTALFVKATTSVTQVVCNAQGYKGT